MVLESPLTRCGCIGIIKILERAARPSGCSEPGTPTRQSLVPGFYFFQITGFIDLPAELINLEGNFISDHDVVVDIYRNAFNLELYTGFNIPRFNILIVGIYICLK